MGSKEERSSAEWRVEIERNATDFLLDPSKQSENSIYQGETLHRSSTWRFIHRAWWLQPLIITILSTIICTQFYRDSTAFHARCVKSISIHCKYRYAKGEQKSTHCLQLLYLRQDLANTRPDISTEHFSFRLFGEANQALSLTTPGMISSMVRTGCDKQAHHK